MATGDEIRASVEEALAYVASSLSAEATRAALDNTASLRRWLDGIDNQLVTQLNRHFESGATEDAKEYLTKCRGRKEARLANERAKTGAAIKPIGDLYDSGDISGDHVDAVRDAESGLTSSQKAEFEAKGDELAEAAMNLSPEEFRDRAKDVARDIQRRHGCDAVERRRRQRRITQRLDAEGMHRTEIIVDEHTNTALWASLDRIFATATQEQQTGDDRSWDQFRVDALVQHLSATSAVNATGTVVHPRITAIVDGTTLGHGCHAGTVCEYDNGTPVPVDVIRRYCCDAVIDLAVINEHGVVTSVGRTQRVATAAQRTALRAMYRTCAHPNCRVSFDRCRIHHIVFWAAGGTSDLSNLVPVCDEHHHLVHDSGWTLRLDGPDTKRHLQWLRPNGTVFAITRPERTGHSKLVSPPPNARPPDPPRGPAPDLGDPFPATLFGSVA